MNSEIRGDPAYKGGESKGMKRKRKEKGDKRHEGHERKIWNGLKIPGPGASEEKGKEERKIGEKKRKMLRKESKKKRRKRKREKR